VASGGTAVFVGGTDMAPGSVCKFGAVTVAAMSWLMDTRTQCVTAAQAPGQTVFVSVSNNGQEFSPPSRDAYFDYVRDPAISVLSNGRAIESGGSSLSIHTEDFFLTEHSRVRVGLVELVPSTFVDSSLLVRVPAHRPGFAAIEVNVDQGNFTTSGHQIMFASSPTLSAYVPARAPMGGGTVVHAVGDDFADTDVLECRFGASVTEGVFVSSSYVKCGGAPTTVTAGETELVVANDAVEQTGSGASFNYVPSMEITSINPTVGPATGGVMIDINGQDFGEQSYGLTCQFGSVKIQASLKNSNGDTMTAECKTPATAPGTYFYLELSNNGIDFTENENEFGS